MLGDLRSQRLILREVELADGPIFEAYQSRPEHWRRQAVEPQEFADGELRIKRYQQYRGPDDNRRLYVFGAVEAKSGILLGQVSLAIMDERTAELGISVAYDHHGKGLGSEMAARMIGWGFDALRLRTIEAYVAIENIACRRLLEKTGMIVEDRSENSIFAQGRWWTEDKYAIHKH